MPWMPALFSASFTSSTLNGLITAVMSFMRSDPFDLVRSVGTAHMDDLGVDAVWMLGERPRAGDCSHDPGTAPTGSQIHPPNRLPCA